KGFGTPADHESAPADPNSSNGADNVDGDGDESTAKSAFGSINAKVETFEENESTLFSGKAKLYELVSGQNWAERGVGVIKVNLNNDTGKSRLIMRTDVTFRLILNAPLFDQVLPKQENSFVRLSLILVGESTHPVTYAIKMASPEQAHKLSSSIKSLFPSK
ncbi:Nuclear pore complex protein NUP50A, partial [Smittium mucronatum]